MGYEMVLGAIIGAWAVAGAAICRAGICRAPGADGTLAKVGGPPPSRCCTLRRVAPRFLGALITPSSLWLGW